MNENGQRLPDRDVQDTATANSLLLPALGQTGAAHEPVLLFRGMDAALAPHG